MTAPAEPLDPVQAVQAGVYARLTGDPQLMALLANQGVYDDVPEDSPLDYVTIRDILGTPDDNHSTYGRQIVLTVHTWTRANGNGPGNAIGGRVYSLLHQGAADLDPLVTGHTVQTVRWEFGQSLDDPKPGIRHRVDRFRIFTEQGG